MSRTLTLYNIVDIQYAPLKYSGDADKRLNLIDEIIQNSNNLSICTGVADNEHFPSKTIVDFIYHQFHNFTKSKQSIASLEKQERIALFENKVLIRGICDRFRAAGHMKNTEEEIYEKLMLNYSGQNPSDKQNRTSSAISLSNSSMGPKRSVSRQRSAHDKQSSYQILPNLDEIDDASLKNMEPRLLFNFCYECCRSILRNSCGRVDSLKKLTKITNLDRHIYYCSSYCKNKVIERLKLNNNLLSFPKKNKNIQKLSKIADEISAMHVTINTSNMSVGNPPQRNLPFLVNSSGSVTTLTPRTGKLRTIPVPAIHEESNQNTSQQSTSRKSRISKRLTHSPRQRLTFYGPQINKEASLLSLRNEKFNLPMPVQFNDSIHLKNMGLVNDLKENYSYN